MRWILLVLLSLCLLTLPAIAKETKKQGRPTSTTKSEEALGKKTAEAIEKECKLVDDEAAVKRLNDIAAKIAPFTERPGVVYNCKILDDPSVNAMSIPGGIIYFTKGLMNAAESDDELAGVMAHEIAHNSCFHIKRSMEESKKISLAQLGALIAILAGAKPKASDIPTLTSMSLMVKEALKSDYSIKLEEEADLHAIDYLHDSKAYNPQGLYSVLLGLIQMEENHPMRDPGYLRDHPYSKERKAYLEKYFKEKNILINLWPVVNFRATVEPPARGEKEFRIKLGTTDILSIIDADGEKDAATRADNIAAAINYRLSRAFVQSTDVYTIDESAGGKPSVTIAMLCIPVITLTQADADAAGIPLETLGAIVMQNVKSALSDCASRHRW